MRWLRQSAYSMKLTDVCLSLIFILFLSFMLISLFHLDLLQPLRFLNYENLSRGFLPAIHGLLPPYAIKCNSAFLDFCYFARCSDFDTATLNALNDALHHFHTYHEVFHTSGVWESGFSFPCQHSLVHYHKNIEDFRSPNGLCSLTME
jgi:hypothetical protein